LIFHIVVAGTAAAPRKADDAVAHNERGMILYAKGDLAGAIAEYVEVYRLNPDYPRVKSDLAELVAKKAATKSKH
jgi:Flp pilus assembly protein TadD